MAKTRLTAPDLTWLPEPEAHNYPAAESYLHLLYGEAETSALIERLRQAPVVLFKAKDIFRASQLSRLGLSNAHIQADRRKIKKRMPLSPLLLVRDQAHGRVLIADGYHRLCALYGFNEDVWVPCKIV